MLNAIRAALVRVFELLRPRSRSTADQAEELRSHTRAVTAEDMRPGMNAADARRAAIVRRGRQERVGGEPREVRGSVAVDDIVRDARYALRRIRRAPAFAVSVIATLGVGLGTAVGIGAIVYDVLVRDLPYAKPEQLVSIAFHTDGFPESGELHSDATFIHFAATARSFTDLGAYATNDAFALTDRDVAERVTVAMMSPSTFDVLGVRPVIGTLFERKDTSWVARDQLLPILISQQLWERRYGGDPKIIGRRVDLDHGPRMVIGVLPRSFQFPSPSVSIWYPAALTGKRAQIESRAYTVIGRLREGVSTSAAQAELNTLVPALSTHFPKITPDLLKRSRARVSIESLRSATIAPVRSQLVVLGLLVALILVIATTNVVNLFLLRTERTAQEIAIALSLGTSRAALAQRFVIEGVLLGLSSGIVAVPAAALALSTKFGFTEREIPRLHEVSFTVGTVALTLASAATIGAAVGLIGLTRAGVTGLAERLRAARMSSSRTWRRTRNALVALQVAIALTLLVGATLLGRSFWNLQNARIGFEPANTMTFQVSLPYGPSGITSYADQAAFHAQLRDRLATLPGVSSVGGAVHLPLSGGGTLGYELQLRAGDDEARQPVTGTGNLATGDYFQAMGIPIRAGRSFQPGDLRGGPAVVLSARLATSIFGTTDVVGRSILGPALQADAPLMRFRVVGVVGDIQRDRIEDGDAPMAYFPLLRDGDGLPADSRVLPYRATRLQLVLRGTRLPDAPAIQRIVSEIDRRVPAASIRTLVSVVDEATARVRLTMLLIGVASTAAMLLGVIGVYSVVSYTAAERMREFGIRMALGAAPGRVRSIVLGDGLGLVSVGIVAGLVTALAATRLLRALLYGVAPTSIGEFVSATVLLLTVTLAATWLPARRAARTPPATVLREA